MSPNGVSTMSPDKTLDRAIQYPRSVFTGSPIEIGCFRFRSFNSAEVGQARLRVKPGDDSRVDVNLIEKCSRQMPRRDSMKSPVSPFGIFSKNRPFYRYFLMAYRSMAE